MLNENMVAIARRELDDAIQKYMATLYSEKAGIVTKWFVSAEVADESDSVNLYLGTSDRLGAWDLVGMAWITARQVFSSLSQP